jgi:hypothetical protein
MPRKGLNDAFESGDTGNRSGLAAPAGSSRRPLSVQPPAEAGREAAYLEGFVAGFNHLPANTAEIAARTAQLDSARVGGVDRSRQRQDAE